MAKAVCVGSICNGKLKNALYSCFLAIKLGVSCLGSACSILSFTHSAYETVWASVYF